MPPEAAGGANPAEIFGEDFAGGVGVDENLDAQARGFHFWGAIVARVREGAKDDVEAGGSLLDGGFGEAGDLKKAAGERGIAPGPRTAPSTGSAGFPAAAGNGSWLLPAICRSTIGISGHDRPSRTEGGFRYARGNAGHI